ncbi:type IV secretory system conjugative DNA transfer family protein [Parachryseolinea silvisoli]|uniref:type IV secretory system conjugative DNA transfer family protein n=1 Tax=Parachryseolinea silvisoli TaxID=2873601 RepID=UPI002265D5EA|nr:type IV secretory system conjugative DNA transfer family protein [Parachryseolinea silvisoli]MCD9015353.1 type IV secretory system conjugative DNA transfer family protein [Parachryseolinea silvisoli]
MKEILRNIARPYLFLLQEGSLATLLALLLSATLYGYYYQIPAKDFLSLTTDYISKLHDPVVVLFRIASFLSIFTLLHVAFSKSFLRFANNTFFNWLSFVTLLYFLFSTSATAFYIFVGIGVILLTYKYLITGGDFVYDFSSTPFGDARWSRPSELRDAALVQEDGLILGRDPETGEVIGFKGEGHILTVAKTGAGKGVGVIVPNLLQYSGSVIVVDPKGENFIRSVYARVNRFGQEVCLIDPFGEVYKQIQRQLKRIERIEKDGNMTKNLQDIKTFYTNLQDKVNPPIEGKAAPGVYNKGLNPLQLIENLVATNNYAEVFDQANVIANMLVMKAGERDPHWDEKAKMIIKNVIVFLCLHERCHHEPKTLVTVRDLIFEIFEDDESMAGFKNACLTGESSKYLSKIGSEISLMAGEERMSVLSTTLRHLEFLDSPLVYDNVSRADVDLTAIKKNKQSIYLVLPANKLDAYSRLMRLWVSSLINAISISPEPPVERILMIVDEMAQLGKMEPLLQAVSLLRGYGLNLWMFFQDISQLTSIYGNNQWKTFSSNARVQQFFGISDADTAEYISRLSGMTTVITRTESINSDGGGLGGNGTSHSYAAQERRLLYPDKLYRTNLQFLFVEGLFPIKARKIKFFSDGLFQPGEHLPFPMREELKSFF